MAVHLFTSTLSKAQLGNLPRSARVTGFVPNSKTIRLVVSLEDGQYASTLRGIMGLDANEWLARGFARLLHVENRRTSRTACSSPKPLRNLLKRNPAIARTLKSFTHGRPLLQSSNLHRPRYGRQQHSSVDLLAMKDARPTSTGRSDADVISDSGAACNVDSM
jgi:hypothetical protein